ncbi:MAG: porin family protein [Woeseiaceae bacterium]
MKRVLLLAAALCFSGTAIAQQNDRDDMWEFGLLIFDQGSENLDGADDSSIDVDSTLAYGLTLAYNFNNHFALGGELSWSSPDYDAIIIPDDGVGIPQEINHELSIFSYSLKGTFNLLDGPFTPYAEVGLGWANVDSNIADQPPVTGCWWDPWWGYICDTFYSTYSKTREFYNGALGLRWDLDNGMSLKGSYGVQQLDTSKSTEDASFEMIRFDATWRF